MNSSQEKKPVEINVVLLVGAIISKKWIILLVVLLTSLTVFAYVYRMPNVYRVEVLLAPATDEKSSSVAGLAGKLGGLAGIAGIDLGGSDVDKSTIGIETLKSRAFLTEFIRRHDMHAPLLAARGWSPHIGDWLYESTIYIADQGWTEEYKRKNDTEMLDWMAYKALSKKISVSQDRKTQLIRIGLEGYSPKFCKIWLSNMVYEINQYIRKKDVDEAKKSIEYLKHQIDVTSIAEMKVVLFQLIEQQTKTIMLAEVREGYVFQMLDPPYTPQEKSGPQRPLIVLFAGMGSVIITILIIALSSIRRQVAGYVEV